MTGPPQTTARHLRDSARAALRFVGAVLTVSGVLLVADVGVTLVWQEPVSALLAAREQSSLEAELRAAGEPALAGADERVTTADRAARYARSLRTGRAAGRIVLPTLGRAYVFVHGTDSTSLRRGPGHVADTPLPGEGGTVAFGGHRTTFGAPFRTIDRLRPGHLLRLEMPYGGFTYRVERTRIVAPDAVWVKRRVAYERVILIACHPLYSAARRIVVFARRIRA